MPAGNWINQEDYLRQVKEQFRHLLPPSPPRAGVFLKKKEAVILLFLHPPFLVRNRMIKKKKIRMVCFSGPSTWGQIHSFSFQNAGKTLPRFEKRTRLWLSCMRLDGQSTLHKEVAFPRFLCVWCLFPAQNVFFTASNVPRLAHKSLFNLPCSAEKKGWSTKKQNRENK